VVFARVNVWCQTHGVGEAIRTASFTERLLGAGGVVWFYLYKALLPIELAFIYPQWQVDIRNPLWWLPLMAAVVVTWALWRYRESWGRPFLFAWGFFCAALLPVMGFADAGFMKYSLVADHYQHIAIIGVISLASAGFGTWRQQARGGARTAAIVVAVAVVGTLASLTWRQSRLYRDPMTLYPAALEKNPECWLAHNNLGLALADSGRLQEAIESYQQALRLKPDYISTHNSLGVALLKLGRFEEAIEHYRQAIRLKPDYAKALNNLANA